MNKIDKYIEIKNNISQHESNIDILKKSMYILHNEIKDYVKNTCINTLLEKKMIYKTDDKSCKYYCSYKRFDSHEYYTNVEDIMFDFAYMEFSIYNIRRIDLDENYIYEISFEYDMYNKSMCFKDKYQDRNIVKNDITPEQFCKYVLDLFEISIQEINKQKE